MRLWQQPAQLLPVRVRPVRGETLISYTFRLAAANDLDRPTILLRALGEPTKGLSRSMLDDHDVALNQHSLRRLETFTGIPAQRLRMSLPTLDRTDAPPTAIPATRLYRCRSLRTPCDDCAARLPGRPKIVLRSLFFPQICRRHRRWIDTGQDYGNHQVSVAGVPGIITAHHRYARLRVAAHDHEWLRQQLRRATGIARGWAPSSYRLHPQLHARWKARGAALRPFCDPRNPTPLLVFPEAVAIAEILCDLHWRRHVAMVDNDLHLAWFYRRIAARLGQPPAFVTTTRFTTHDPLQNWVTAHRTQHEHTRTEFWERHHRSRATETPFPEIRHFK
ncbi:MAG: TniQ family protein [Pseudonocardiaceae bacterium]